jgi:hypothetical protein
MRHFRVGVLVVSRPHRRDPKLEQFWRTTLAKWTQSGLNIRDFCRKHRLAEPSFYSWRREIAARDGKPLAQPTTAHTKSVVTRRTFTPAHAPRPSPRRATKPMPQPSFVALRVVPDSPLELVLRSGHTLRIPPGYDANHLRAIVAVLETPPC